MTASTELDHLRSLLLSQDRLTLQHLNARLSDVETSSLAKAELERAMADVLAGALKTAEAQNHRALARAIAPVVVAVIQSEIRNSKEVMVEALYPLTGRLVSAAVTSAVRDAMTAINSKLDKLTSAEHLKLKIKSVVLRKPMSELAVASVGMAQVARILLVEQGSGTLVAAWDNDPYTDTAPELVAGLIAAVSEFAANAVSSRQGELRTLELGSHRLHLWHSPRHIMAVECVGAPSRAQEMALENGFLALVDRSESGEAVTAEVLGNVAADAERIVAPVAVVKRGNAAKWLLMGIAALLVGLVGWWAYSSVTSRLLENRLRAVVDNFLASSPQLTGFPLSVRADHDRRHVFIEGLVPHNADIQNLRMRIETVPGTYPVLESVSRVAQQPDIDRADRDTGSRLDQLAARLVQAQADQTSLLKSTIEQRDAEHAASRTQLKDAIEKQRTDSLKAIQDLRAAIGRDVSEMTTRLAVLDDTLKRLGQTDDEIRRATLSPRALLQRLMEGRGLFFGTSIQFIDEREAHTLIEQVARLMLSGQLTVQLTGMTDGIGPAQENRTLGLARAETVRGLLLQHNVPAERVTIRNQREPDVALNAPQIGPPSIGRRVIITVVGEP